MINTANPAPGPWKAQGKTVKMTDHGKLYTVATVHNKLFTQEANEANARLIAAAPELLEAAKLAKELCELITKWADAEQSESYSIMDEIVALAQDDTQPAEAIAKAESR